MAATAATARVKWIEGTRFIGESHSGHAIVMQGLPEEGEPSVGIRPMEMLLLGMGGCTAIDVVMILQKAREQVTDVVVEVMGKRAASVPRVYEGIHVHYVVTGRGLKESAVERAIKLSAEKYCSATIMLAATAEVTHDFEIIEAGQKTHSPGR
jgi:putative redox protein